MIHKLRAIVLWSRRSRDADKIVGIYTDTMGRLTARATSAARSIRQVCRADRAVCGKRAGDLFDAGPGWGKNGRRTTAPVVSESADGHDANDGCGLDLRSSPPADAGRTAGPGKICAAGGDTGSAGRRDARASDPSGVCSAVSEFAGFGLDHRDPWLALQTAIIRNAPRR